MFEAEARGEIGADPNLARAKAVAGITTVLLCTIDAFCIVSVISSER